MNREEEKMIQIRLTKKKALQLTEELWKWMAKNPGEHKAAWPGFAEDKYGSMLCYCPCCEYVERKTRNQTIGRDCEKYCPALKLWPFEKRMIGTYIDNMPCEHTKSPYTKWVKDGFNARFGSKEDYPQTIEAATVIYKGIEKILKEG